MSNPFEQYFQPDNLRLAFERVRCWTERTTKDKFGIRAFQSDLDKNLNDLSNTILSGKYIPQRGFKFYEPKPSGTQRPKTLLFIEDALVYQAIADKIGTRNYNKLRETKEFVYGSVLANEVKLGFNILLSQEPNFFFFRHWKDLYHSFNTTLIKAIKEDKVTYKFETDITGFFDSIPHYNLFLTLSNEFGVEDEILDLLSECFNTWSGTKEQITPGVGIPQGPAPSFLFANLMLHPLDKKLIGEAFKYFRYMDDIRIYGYSEDELLNVLVKIDNYLKSNGLSINTKKTKIQKVSDNVEEEIEVFEKKITAISKSYFEDFDPLFFMEPDFEFNEFGDLVPIQNKNDTAQAPAPDAENTKLVTGSMNKSYYEMVEQTEALVMPDTVLNITDPTEIKAYWKKEISTIEQEIPRLFKHDNGNLVLVDEEKTTDITFIDYGTRYSTALTSLKAFEEFKEIAPADNLLDYWIFALKKFFWRAKNYILTLQHYKNNPKLKKALLHLYEKGTNYEAYRYYLIICLTYNFSFTDKELRNFFKMLKADPSELARYALYCLIIKNTNDKQLRGSLQNRLRKEENDYIKKIVLHYWQRDKQRTETMQDLITSIGL